jgi:hypothetical protein
MYLENSSHFLKTSDSLSSHQVFALDSALKQKNPVFSFQSYFFEYFLLWHVDLLFHLCINIKNIYFLQVSFKNFACIFIVRHAWLRFSLLSVWSSHWYVVGNRIYETPHFMFSLLWCPFLPFRTKYPSQYLDLEHPHHTFLNLRDTFSYRFNAEGRIRVPFHLH